MEKRPEDVVHQCLEHGRRVVEAKCHDHKLVRAFMRAERHLVDVLGPHADLVVPRPQVELGEELGAVELIQ